MKTARSKSMAALLAAAVSVVTMTGAQPASAADVTPYACPAETDYSTYNRVAGYSKTDVESYQAAGPSTISYTVTETADQTFSGSAGFSFSANAILATAEATFSVGYSYSTSKSAAWTYTTNVPAGKTAKMRVWHKADQMGFDKFVTSSNCSVATYRNGLAVAPRSDETTGSYCVFRDFYPYRTAFMAGKCVGE